jgi:putative membrane protein
VLGSTKRNSGGLGRWLFGLLISVLAFFLSVAIWDFTATLFSRHSIPGSGFSALLSALGAAAILAILRKIRGILRLQKIDDLRVSGTQALAQNDLEKAQNV